jgi:hypothetical protein
MSVKVLTELVIFSYKSLFLRQITTHSYPIRAVVRPPRLRGGLGRGVHDILAAFGELVPDFVKINNALTALITRQFHPLLS